MGVRPAIAIHKRNRSKLALTLRRHSDWCNKESYVVTSFLMVTDIISLIIITFNQLWVELKHLTTTDLHINQPINQSINQSFNQSINQSINQHNFTYHHTTSYHSGQYHVYTQAWWLTLLIYTVLLQQLLHTSLIMSTENIQLSHQFGALQTEAELAGLVHTANVRQTQYH